MTRYKIIIKSTTGQILTYTTSSYEIIDGTLIRFLDEKYNIYKLYDSRNCEINEIESEVEK